jgi:hypothetical protein
MDHLPEIQIDQKVLMGLAVIGAGLAIFLFMENKRLRSTIDHLVLSPPKRPCGCKEKGLVDMDALKRRFDAEDERNTRASSGPDADSESATE